MIKSLQVPQNKIKFSMIKFTFDMSDEKQKDG